MLDEVKAAMVVVWAEHEAMCRLLSKARIDDPILALCPERSTARQLSLLYGLISILHSPADSFEQWVADVETIVRSNNWASNGQKLLLIPPLSVLSDDTDGAIILHTIA
jgi:pyruvate kinase